METVEQQFIWALRRTSRAWRVVLERRIKCYDLNQAAWFALDAIALGTAQLSQPDLAHWLGIDCTAMSPLIDRLVFAGLVQRTRSSADQRVRLVSITLKGLELHEQVSADIRGMQRELLGTSSQVEILGAIDMLESVRSLAETLGNGDRLRQNGGVSPDDLSGLPWPPKVDPSVKTLC